MLLCNGAHNISYVYNISRRTYLLYNKGNYASYFAKKMGYPEVTAHKERT